MNNASLSPEDFASRLRRDANLVHEWLETALRGNGAPEGLLESMEYSLLAGGKRIRPVLLLACAGLFGEKAERVMPFAGAIECIHTYSLIHDDLPAMDDDDLRRGRPSNHKAFDEATAILAGDGLLTDAFALMAQCAERGIRADRVLAAVALAARAAGSAGMVGGQFLDMRYTARRGITLDDVAAMQGMKTGAMLRLCCEAGALLAGADEKGLRAMRAYGAAVGAAFQITDDILDETGTEAALGKPVGSDREQRKNTFPSLLGIESSRDKALALADEAVQALQSFAGEDAAFLRGLAGHIANRVR